jgi:membrane protein DedA with SNARE-associated domain
MEAAVVYSFIIIHGYFFLLLLLIVEGPIVAYLGGLAANFGYLNFPLVILLAIIGSISADTVFFLLGRFRRDWVHDWVKKKKSRQGALTDINEQIVTKPIRTLFYIKLMPYLSVPGFVLAGMSDIKWWRFILHGTWIGAIYISVFAVLGWLSAIPLRTIDNSFGWVQLGLFVVGVVGAAYWFYKKRYNREHKNT